jgi:hypothetical protein
VRSLRRRHSAQGVNGHRFSPSGGQFFGVLGPEERNRRVAPSLPSGARKRLESLRGMRLARILPPEERRWTAIGFAALAFLTGLVIPQLNSCFSDSPGPETRPVDVTVRNSWEFDDDASGDGGVEVQRDESMPTLDLTLHNVGERLSVVSRARFVVTDFAELDNCDVLVDGGGGAAGGGTGVVRLLGRFNVRLPPKPRIGQTIDRALNRQVASDDAARLVFRFATLRVRDLAARRNELPVQGPVRVYRLATSLLHDGERDGLPVGTVVLSVPNLPGVAELHPSAAGSGQEVTAAERHDQALCAQRNAAALDRLTRPYAIMSTELHEIAHERQ